MICKKCGMRVHDGSRRCPICGDRLVLESAEEKNTYNRSYRQNRSDSNDRKITYSSADNTDRRNMFGRNTEKKTTASGNGQRRADSFGRASSARNTSSNMSRNMSAGTSFGRASGSRKKGKFRKALTAALVSMTVVSCFSAFMSLIDEQAEQESDSFIEVFQEENGDASQVENREESAAGLTAYSADYDTSYDVQDPQSMLNAISSEFALSKATLSGEGDKLIEEMGGAYDRSGEYSDSIESYRELAIGQCREMYDRIDEISLEYFRYTASQGVGTENYLEWHQAISDYYDLIMDEGSNFSDVFYDEDAIWMDSELNRSLSEIYAAATEKYLNAYFGAWGEFAGDGDNVDALLVMPLPNAKPVDGEERSSGDYTYILYDDGTAEIISYSGDASAVDVNYQIDGYRIGRIGANAFENHTEIETCFFYAAPIKIGEEAFKGCSNMTDFVLLNENVDIAGNAFEGCTKLETAPGKEE